MLVSIIIPCYNVEDYIEECVESAFAQTHLRIEVICVDNNSSDSTVAKLEALQKRFPALKIAKEPRAGAPYARNKGFELSRGMWLQFLDADDLLLPNKIEHQIDIAIQHPAIAFIAASCVKRDLNGNDVTIDPVEDNPFESLFTTKLGNTCSNLWNRMYIEMINGWDESLKSSQEADLMFRLLQINDNVAYDFEPMTIVRERPFGQISQGNHADKWVRYFNKRMEMAQWLRENRPEHYRERQYFYEDTLFGILKIIAKESKDGAKVADKLYRKHMKGYKPSPHQTHSTPGYIKLMKIFGFKGAETIRRWTGR